VDPRVQRLPITKPIWGCYEEMHPKKPRDTLEPALNFKTEILLDHSKERLSLADQDLVFTEIGRVFFETPSGGEELLQ
jgi:hypothetical protein